jgi:hypothetical protein
MRFMLLMIPKGYETAEPGEMPDLDRVEAMLKYNAELEEADVLVMLDGLHPLSTGARVTFSAGRPSVSEGPFREADEVVAGYWMIDVRSRQEAIAWASRCPASDNEVIEIRQVQDVTDFPIEVRELLARFSSSQHASA